MMTATEQEVDMPIAVISSKYQIVIPKEIRERLDLKPGQPVALIEREGLITLVPKRPIAELRGIARGVPYDDYRDKTDRF